MLKRIEDLQVISAKSADDQSAETALEKEFEEKLSSLEQQVSALKMYLMQEKKADIQLKVDAQNTINDMKTKVEESKTLTDELKGTVKNSLDDFNTKIDKVNKTAHLTVNVKGVVFIGSIGSTCSYDAEDCNLPQSECRDRKCQCEIGLSFDNELNQCTDTCKQYGCTFQSARQRIIREFNDKIIENVTLSECKDHCIQETDFLCKSFDYFPRWETCYMSQRTKIDTPEEAWEYNSAGTHFQRDCLGIKELSLCNEN